MEAAMRAEEAADGARFSPGRLKWAAALVVVLIGVTVLIEAGGASPAAAAIGEIAEVTRELDPIAPSDDSFVYGRADTVVLVNVPVEGLGGVPFDRSELLYLLPILRESWFGSDNTVEITSVAGEPSFFAPDDADVYVAAGLDELDQVGVASTSIVTMEPEFWPTDSASLDAAIRDAMATDRGLPETVEYLDVALDIVRESFASPEVRSTALGLVAGLDGLELGTPTAEGASTFYIDYVERGVEVRYTFSIDGNGYFRSEEIRNLTADTQLGIPADVATFGAEYSAPVVTESLDSP